MDSSTGWVVHLFICIASGGGMECTLQPRNYEIVD